MSPGPGRAARTALATDPVADPAAVLAGDGQGGSWRVTVLTDGLLRYEWAPDGVFEDRASTFAVRRRLPVPDFRVVDGDAVLEVVTERFHLVYDRRAPSPSGLSVEARGGVTNHQSTWRYGTSGDDLGPRVAAFDLPGTASTLDEADGAIPLEPGVVSRRGIAVLDDSRTMLFDGSWVAGRRPGAGGDQQRVDLYVFAYGLDFAEAVRALHAVSGPPPVLPRWALGTWWSRYHRYTAEEYVRVLDRFAQERVPLSVAVLDMDWHVTDVTDPAGVAASGWTGFTWDRALFPDPPAFLAALHERGLRVSLNLHPADGVRAHEQRYAEVARALGRDAASVAAGEPVAFDIADPAFADAYFDELLRPLEREGVDLWWVDWQQGEYTRLPGVRPLWLLNHLHFLDSAVSAAARGDRPLTFSRYAGPGSHRYPVGFSGDTVISWASLAFQPEFTASAANIGYGWWSHDVGGHLPGLSDEELFARWVQLGVWSPVLRLHSSNSPFIRKEPWALGPEARAVVGDALRLRARLVPYLHSANRRAARDGEPLVRPVYWTHPREEAAYDVPGQAWFGTQLLVAPVTAPRDPRTRLGAVRAWLPPGRWVDLLTGTVHDGDRELLAHRPLGGTPVFAPQGAVVPLDGAAVPPDGTVLPAAVEVVLVVGADGAFDLEEDDGTAAADDDAGWASTRITYDQAAGVLRIAPPTGAPHLAPAERTWSVRLPAVRADDLDVAVHVGEEVGEGVAAGRREAAVAQDGPAAVVAVGAVARDEPVEVRLGPDPRLAVTDPAPAVVALLLAAQVEHAVKAAVGAAVEPGVPVAVRAGRVAALGLERPLLDAVLELLLADSRVP